jgi:hypothetical protein
VSGAGPSAPKCKQNRPFGIHSTAFVGQRTNPRERRVYRVNNSLSIVYHESVGPPGPNLNQYSISPLENMPELDGRDSNDLSQGNLFWLSLDVQMMRVK